MKPHKLEINQICTLGNYGNCYCLIRNYPLSKSPDIIIGTRKRDYRKLKSPYARNHIGSNHAKNKMVLHGKLRKYVER